MTNNLLGWIDADFNGIVCNFALYSTDDGEYPLYLRVENDQGSPLVRLSLKPHLKPDWGQFDLGSQNDDLAFFALELVANCMLPTRPNVDRSQDLRAEYAAFLSQY